MTVQPLTKFTGGEFDPLLNGRTDLAAYPDGLRRALNCVAVPQGPAHRRPGTRRAGAAAPTSLKTCSFVFGVGDAYTLEFAEKKLRFWRSDGTQVLDGGAAYEIDTPWTAQQATRLRWQQSGDVMWFTHPDVPMQALDRTALAPAETFTLADANEQDGPYYTENATATTATPAGTGTGDIVVTMSADVFDYDATRDSLDLGRMFRIKDGTTGGTPDNQGWAWGKIKAVASKTVATVTFVTTVNATTAVAAWRLGLYSARTGFASSICIHQERLARGSNVANSFPRIDLSTSGNFLTFKPGTDDDLAIQIVVGVSLGNKGVPVVRDLQPGRVLIVLTGAGNLRVTTSDSSSALTPLNIDLSPIASSTGSADAAAQPAQGSVLFLDPQRQSLGEIKPTSDIYADALGYREISIRNGHLLRRSPGLMIAWADKPWGLMAIPREDGVMLLGSYAPAQEVVNLTPQQLANAGKVLSVNVLPTAAGDEIWMLVSRPAGKTMEVLSNLLRENQPDREAVNLDSAITVKDAPDATLTYVSGTATQTWNADADVFDASMIGRAIRVLEAGDTDAMNMPTWSARTLRIATVPAANTITATVEGAAPASPVASGDWLLSMDEVVGLSDLEGMTAGLLADGADMGTFAVSGARIEPPHEVFYATVGLPYRSEFQPMPPNPPTRKGSAAGRPVSGLTRARVVRSGGVRQVKAFGAISGLRPLRKGTEPMDVPPALYTGDMELEKVPDSDTPVAPYLVATGAQPFCIAGLFPDYGVGELG